MLSILQNVFIAASLLAGDFHELNAAKLQREYSKAVASPAPWVGYWWPYVDSGTAESTEKVDRVLGNQSWATSWEEYYHGPSVNPADWWGHCNGWATAAIMEAEPRSTISVGDVDFKIADRKALLSEYWMESGSDMIGTRVYDENDDSSAAFWDVTPSQFHLAMTNYLGRDGQSVIIDRYTGAEVWNQPVVAYEIDPIDRDAYLGPHVEFANLYRMNVTATIWWANDDVDPSAKTPRFKWKENDYYTKRTLRYELWLDSPPEFDASGKLVRSGNVVLTNHSSGGIWKNGTSHEELMNSHPDFIWIPTSYARSSGGKNPRLNDTWVHNNLAD